MSTETTHTPADRAETLDVLACDYEKRPRGAPSFFDLEGVIRDLRREDGSLVIDFDPAAGEAVTALVEAERQCCASIGWDLQRGAGLQLRITAAPEQLDVFEGFLPR